MELKKWLLIYVNLPEGFIILQKPHMPRIYIEARSCKGHDPSNRSRPVCSLSWSLSLSSSVKWNLSLLVSDIEVYNYINDLNFWTHLESIFLMKWKLKIEEYTWSHNLKGCYCQFHVFFKIVYYNQHLKPFAGKCHL